MQTKNDEYLQVQQAATVLDAVPDTLRMFPGPPTIPEHSVKWPSTGRSY